MKNDALVKLFETESTKCLASIHTRVALVPTFVCSGQSNTAGLR
jgi:hypothetical protein